jgi:hypothetical protein
VLAGAGTSATSQPADASGGPEQFKTAMESVVRAAEKDFLPLKGERIVGSHVAANEEYKASAPLPGATECFISRPMAGQFTYYATFLDGFDNSRTEAIYKSLTDQMSYCVDKGSLIQKLNSQDQGNDGRYVTYGLKDPGNKYPAFMHRLEIMLWFNRKLGYDKGEPSTRNVIDIRVRIKEEPKNYDSYQGYDEYEEEEE